MRHAANGLTAARILLVPVIVACQQIGSWRTLAAAVALMALAEITDALDGFVARRFSGVTTLGKIIDPMADSIYRSSLFVAFAVSGWIPLWMALVFLWRDVLVSYLRVHVSIRDPKGGRVAARLSGKLKAISQAAAQIFAVVVWAWAARGGDLLGFTPGELTRGAVLVALVVTVYSAVDYSLALSRGPAPDQTA